MKCPFCEEEGKTSKVYVGIGSSTLMAHSPYYDENGQFHMHDPNTHTGNYTCSNGHAWSDSEIRGCSSCDYGRKHTITRIK